MGLASLLFLGAILGFLIFCLVCDYLWSHEPRRISPGFAAFVLVWIVCVAGVRLVNSDWSPAFVGGMLFLLLLMKGGLEVTRE